jgi:type IV secretory pathway VirB2 component (pilin)
MANFHLKRWGKSSLISLGVLSANLQSAFASSMGGLPFTSTMNTIKDAISGPFLLAAAVIMIVITCLMLAFGEWGDGFKKLINIVLWLSIAFAATGFVTSLFGGGALF